ncbi:unnamed protein product [Rangifer tarandus platyrhynchus]|uniref:Uncharacterized protein n=1 Tax=Rangifer tarandus platyrhynchus TaxID=3082113 RepID=A0ABN8YJT6_RANTA|nr:unnamed protein product [Rangifer tarandus platyrhynchus]
MEREVGAEAPGRFSLLGFLVRINHVWLSRPEAWTCLSTPVPSLPALRPASESRARGRHPSYYFLPVFWTNLAPNSHKKSSSVHTRQKTVPPPTPHPRGTPTTPRACSVLGLQGPPRNCPANLRLGAETTALPLLATVHLPLGQTRC